MTQLAATYHNQTQPPQRTPSEQIGTHPDRTAQTQRITTRRNQTQPP